MVLLQLNEGLAAMRLATGFAAPPLLNGLVASFSVRAQPPTFDVASIKPAKPGQIGTTSNLGQGNTLNLKNYALIHLVMRAYDVPEFQVSGASGWMVSLAYDIVATADRVESEPARRFEQTRLRLQALLADRFQLQIHRETKELPIYALVVAKNGPRLQENKESGMGGNLSTSIGRTGTITGRGSSIKDLAKALSRILSRPVDDKTGLTAAFDFKLTWLPDSASPETAAASDLPSLFTALQQQLGLRLESRKGPVEIIVIDRASKPSEN